MYKCKWCGAKFEDPDTRTIRENLDGENGWWTHTEIFCPECGSDEIREVRKRDK